MRSAVIYGASLLIFVAEAHAQTAHCDAVLRTVQNVAIRTSLKERFEERQYQICRDQFQKFGSARDSETSIGFDVVDTLSFAFGGETTEENFGERRDRFCSFTFTDFANIASSFEQVAMIDRHVIDAWQGCVLAQSRGFAIALTPGSNNGSFLVQIVHRNPVDPTFEINGWSFKPEASATDAECEVVGAEEERLPIEIPRGSATLLCEKNPAVTLQYAISTNQGDFGIELIGTDDELRDLREEVKTLHAQLDYAVRQAESANEDVDDLKEASRDFVTFGTEVQLYSSESKTCLRGVGGSRAEKSAYMLACDPKWVWEIRPQ